jgi:hypothetical protein
MFAALFNPTRKGYPFAFLFLFLQDSCIVKFSCLKDPVGAIKVLGPYLFSPVATGSYAGPGN